MYVNFPMNEIHNFVISIDYIIFLQWILRRDDNYISSNFYNKMLHITGLNDEKLTFHGPHIDINAAIIHCDFHSQMHQVISALS